jgi:mono/diheme cytochrome c family protein
MRLGLSALASFLLACGGNRDARAAAETAAADSADSIAVATAPVDAIPPVYAAAQADSGEKIYTRVCVSCHTMGQFSSAEFVGAWNQRRVYDLYELLASTMPQSAPGSLSTKEYVDVTAYLLKLAGTPAAKDALTDQVDVMKKMRIGITRSSE